MTTSDLEQGASSPTTVAREIDIRLCEYFSPLSVLFLDGAFIIGNPERKLGLSMNPMFLE
jgi:hypothetical protein